MTHGQGLAGLRTLNHCKSQGKCRSCPGGRRLALGRRGSPWPLRSPAVRHMQQACPPKSSVCRVSRHTCLPCRGVSLTQTAGAHLPLFLLDGTEPSTFGEAPRYFPDCRGGFSFHARQVLQRASTNGQQQCSRISRHQLAVPAWGF